MAKGDLRYEDIGAIYARENLRRSCHVQIGENELKQLSDLTEAAIIVKGKSGCKITPIAELTKE